MTCFSATPRTKTDSDTASSSNPITFRSINYTNQTFLYAFKDGMDWRGSWELTGY